MESAETVQNCKKKLPQEFKYLPYSVIEVFRVERSSLPGHAGFVLDEEVNVCSIQAAESTAVAPVYSNRIVLYVALARRNEGSKPMVLKHSQSEIGIPYSVINRPKILDTMMELQTEEVHEVNVKTEDIVLDLVDPSTSS